MLRVFEMFCHFSCMQSNSGFHILFLSCLVIIAMEFASKTVYTVLFGMSLHNIV